MKIGVTGASGHLGSLVVAGLKAKIPAENIVALVRSAKKQTLPGIETREADYEKPETLEVALKGIDTLMLISANEIGKRAFQHKNVVAAAGKAHVKWIVYTSFLS